MKLVLNIVHYTNVHSENQFCYCVILKCLIAGIMSHDIAYTLQSLGIIQKSENTDKPYLVIDWAIVSSYMKKAESNNARIKIDPECLRWTPLISPIGVRLVKIYMKY